MTVDDIENPMYFVREKKFCDVYVEQFGRDEVQPHKIKHQGARVRHCGAYLRSGKQNVSKTKLMTKMCGGHSLMLETEIPVFVENWF